MFVVTGGGSGIGQALAWALAGREKKVLIIGRHEASLIETAKASAHIDYLCADVSLPAGRKLIENQIQQNCIEGLVHNAGIIDPILPIKNISEQAWQKVMAINVEAPLFLTQALSKLLVGGKVLHIGSGAAYFPIQGWSAYCVSKAALAMLTRCWQLESTDIAFASVMPGIIDTPMQSVIRNAEHMASEKRDFFRKLKQQKHLISPATVALFLAWLLLDVDKVRFSSQEWDIYDSTHHPEWLTSPHTITPLEE